jgi:hypothetical protein
MIWDYVLTDNCIILRQRGDRLTYEFMLENEAHEIQKIKPEDLSSREHTFEPNRGHGIGKSSLLPLLQACQMM